MTSASVGVPVTLEESADGAGVPAAISMPGSSAAVLTPISTPPVAESCASRKSGVPSEVLSLESDSVFRTGLESGLTALRSGMESWAVVITESAPYPHKATTAE